MSQLARQSIALVMLLAAAVIGSASLITFTVFLYSGSLDWVDLDIGEVELLLIDALLSLAFFLQHSGMVRKPFRRYLGSLIPLHYQGAVYTITSGLVLSVFVVFWQGSDRIVLEVHGPAGEIIHSLFFLSILGMCWGLWALRSVDMFGFDPVIRNLRDRSSLPTPFTVQGPYRWVRHPLYLFLIVLFWSCPTITSDRLLFNVLWTIWVIVATTLEERDLVADFGDAYRDYQAKVPMLLPRGFRPAYTDDISDKVD